MFIRTSMIARVALGVGLCLATLGSTNCSFSSGNDSDDGNGGPGDDSFSVSLLIRNSSGAADTDFVFGEPIHFVVEGRNRSDGTVRLQYPDGQLYDVIVTHQTTGRVEWRWSDNQAFTQLPRTVTYGPRSTQGYQVPWNGELPGGDHLPPGDYEARGVLTTSGFEGQLSEAEFDSPPVTFRVF
jgi:hypothetical protein